MFPLILTVLNRDYNRELLSSLLRTVSTRGNIQIEGTPDQELEFSQLRKNAHYDGYQEDEGKCELHAYISACVYVCFIICVFVFLSFFFWGGGFGRLAR